MTDDQRKGENELDAEPELVKDLDVDDDDAEVRGGNSYVAGPTRGSIASK